MIGRDLGGYRVVSHIGRGGMGVVYKAEDVKLARAVAIKVLPPDLTADTLARRRLVNEARAASNLDHRHICTIHHVGETEDGLLYIVMPYYDGETLAQRIVRGPLPVETATRFALQIAHGLAAAHEAGVVHRDVKPANIIVTSREELKILDFGFAKMAQIAALSTGHASGGTPAYMSPEQVRGDDVDARADIWALGVVVYEMIAGARPFRGETGQAVMFNILGHEPRALSTLRDGVPETLDRAVSRALAKDRTQRFASIGDFVQAFDPFGTTTYVSPGKPRARPTDLPSILVLPFDNLSQSADDAYVSDGLTDEIIADLSSTPGLRVMSRTTAKQLKEAQKDIRTLARELGVTYVVEGSVRKTAGAFRVVAKLIDASADTAMWVEKYQGGLEDVFGIQETISRKIVDALSLKLAPTASSRRRFEDPDAYDKYLRAKQEMNRYSKDSLDRALEFLQSSVRRVGENNVLLTTAIGQVHWQYFNAGVSRDPSTLEKAQECGERVLALDPEAPHGYRLLGLVKVTQGKLQESVKLLGKALEKDPNDVEAMVWQCANYFVAGKPDAGVVLAERVAVLDPLTPMYQCAGPMMAIARGDFEAAVEPMLLALRMDPGNPGIRLYCGVAYALTGRVEEAERVLGLLVTEQTETWFGRFGRAYVHGLRGEKQAALAAIDATVIEAASADMQYAWQLSQCYVLAGDLEKGLAMLERSVELGFINHPLLSRHDPYLEPLRSDPRFVALMERVKERWEAFEV